MSITMILSITAVLLLTIAVPLGVMRYLRKRGGTWKDFLAGAGTFILFALILEQLLHILVLKSPLGPVIQGNIWLYGIYGGLAAGIFEETGRFLAFRSILKNRQSRITSLTYGIGHGGIEAFLITGLMMVSNLVLGLLYVRGVSLPAEIVPSVEALLSTPAGNFFWAGLERLTAMTLHLSLSVLVFTSLRTSRRWLYPAAILLHTAVDFSVVTSNFLSIAATEILILAATLLIAAWAASIYKKLPEIAENT